jgi:O-antigen/teichoic acid export membrane protein
LAEGAEPGSPDATMRARVLGGLAWKSVSQIVLQGLRLVVAIVLARLLTPEEYGLAGMVLAFSGLVLLFSDLGFGAALIQRRTLSEEDRSTVFWTSLAVGAGFVLLGVGLSGVLADFYGEPRVQPLFAVLSVVFLVSSIESTQVALLTRELNFRSVEIRRIASAVSAATVGLTAAAYGGGAWAIIAYQLTGAVVSMTLVWTLSPWRPRFVYSLASLRRLGAYSSKVLSWDLLFYLNRNADNVLIGRFLGPSALGVYAFAYNIMLYPLARIASPIRAVLFPAFARMQDDRARVASTWIRANRVIAAFAMPALFGMTVVAPDFVSVVLGERWSDAVPIIQILAWVGLIQALQRLNGSVLQACDRAGLLLLFSMLVFVTSLVAFVIGLQWGIVGVAVGYAVASAFLQPFYMWLTARTVGVGLWAAVRSLSGVLQASLLMLAAVLAARLLLVEQAVPAAIRLPVVVGVAILVYVPACIWRAPEVLAEVRALRGRRDTAARSAQQLAPAQGG